MIVQMLGDLLFTVEVILVPTVIVLFVLAPNYKVTKKGLIPLTDRFNPHNRILVFVYLTLFLGSLVVLFSFIFGRLPGPLFVPISMGYYTWFAYKVGPTLDI